MAAITLQLSGLTAIQGVVSAAIAARGFALAVDLLCAGGEDQQMGMMAMGFGFGIALGPLPTGAMAIYAFQLLILLCGLLCLVGAWIVHHFVPETVLGGATLGHPSRQSHNVG